MIIEISVLKEVEGNQLHTLEVYDYDGEIVEDQCLRSAEEYIQIVSEINERKK